MRREGRLPWFLQGRTLRGTVDALMAEEGWDFVEGLKRTKTARVCMTCQHFTYLTDEDCRTLLSCGLQKRLVPHGEHLSKKCRNWMVRREVEVGWCPEVA